MMQLIPKFTFPFFLFTLLILIVPPLAFSKDITAKVIKDTELDERVSLFCSMYCVGNMKKGTVESITVKKSKDDKYKVFGKAALRNRQVTSDITLYDRTIFVNSTGELDPESCRLTVEDVKVENDFQNIVTNLLKSNTDVIGKVIVVPDCKSYL